jgi:spoIIIJ-associated protein
LSGVEWVEVTGRTLEEAKEAALDQLGVAEADAEVIVLAEPRAGLFGRLRGEARVRARVQPVGARPKRTRRPREREKDRGARRGGGSREGQRGATEEGRPEATRRKAPDSGATAGAAEGDGGGDRKATAGRRRSGTKAGAGGRSTAALEGGVNDTAGPGGPGTNEEIGMAEGMTLQEQAEVAREFLEGLLERFGVEATVGTRVIDEQTVEVAATGGDGLGMLVGPRGSTLAALQDVTRTVVQRRFPSKTDRILVDVAGYRERRAAALQRFSTQVAEEVLASGSERALEPMSPPDRKVVHDTINEIEGVVTRSEGEDPSRYIVIAPSG